MLVTLLEMEGGRGMSVRARVMGEHQSLLVSLAFFSPPHHSSTFLLLFVMTILLFCYYYIIINISILLLGDI